VSFQFSIIAQLVFCSLLSCVDLCNFLVYSRPATYEVEHDYNYLTYEVKQGYYFLIKYLSCGVDGAQLRMLKRWRLANRAEGNYLHEVVCFSSMFRKNYQNLPCFVQK